MCALTLQVQWTWNWFSLLLIMVRLFLSRTLKYSYVITWANRVENIAVLFFLFYFFGVFGSWQNNFVCCFCRSSLSVSPVLCLCVCWMVCVCSINDRLFSVLCVVSSCCCCCRFSMSSSFSYSHSTTLLPYWNSGTNFLSLSLFLDLKCCYPHWERTV